MHYSGLIHQQLLWMNEVLLVRSSFITSLVARGRIWKAFTHVTQNHDMKCPGWWENLDITLVPCTKAEEGMDRKQRLLRLLSEGRKNTKDELRKALGLKSTRHVLRLIKALREEGVPIEEELQGRKKYFFLKPEHRHLAIQPIQLSEAEIMALVVAVQAARAALAPTPFQEPLQLAFKKLIDNFAARVISFEPEKEPRHWHFGEAHSVDLDPDIFRLVVRAVQNRQSLRIDYYTASRREWSYDRKINPLLVGVRNGSWLLVAYCHRRQEVVDFSLAGIAEAHLCDPEEEQAYFSLPKGFDPEQHFRARFSAVSGEEVYEVRLLVAPDRAPYFKRKTYHPSQQIEEENEEGWTIISYEVEGLKEVRAFVRSWGPGVIVMEPDRLARQVEQDARELMEQYEQMLANG